MNDGVVGVGANDCCDRALIGGAFAIARGGGDWNGDDGAVEMAVGSGRLRGEGFIRSGTLSAVPGRLTFRGEMAFCALANGLLAAASPGTLGRGPEGGGLGGGRS